MTFTRYLGNNAGLGSRGLAGLSTAQQLTFGTNALLRDARSLEGEFLGLPDNSLAGREFAQNYANNQAAGLNPVANNAALFNSSPYAAQANQALLASTAQLQALAPLAQAAEAAGARNAFGGINQGVSGLLGLQGAGVNFNGAGALTTNSLLGQSILGPQLYQQQLSQLGLNGGRGLANQILGGQASTGGRPPLGGFFGNQQLNFGFNPLDYQNQFGIERNGGYEGFKPLRELGRFSGQTLKLS